MQTATRENWRVAVCELFQKYSSNSFASTRLVTASDSNDTCAPAVVGRLYGRLGSEDHLAIASAKEVLGYKWMVGASTPNQTGSRRLWTPHLKGVNAQLAWPRRVNRPRLRNSPLGTLIFIVLVAVCRPTATSADSITVRISEGPTHGFLLLKTLDGQVIAEGDLIESLKGATLRTQTSFHFHDGSYYEETTEFSQHGQFRFLSDRLVQKGPSFKQTMDRSIDGSTGQVVVHYTDDKGNEKTESQHIDLPPDLANGMFLTLIKNIDPGKAETMVTVVAGAPKPRLVKVIITPQGRAPFVVGKSKREAIVYDLKPKIEGAAGVIAPLVGKQPADTRIWVLPGSVPAVLKSEGPLEPEGPVWRTEMASPVWPSDAVQK